MLIFIIVKKRKTHFVIGRKEARGVDKIETLIEKINWDKSDEWREKCIPEEERGM